MRAVCNADGGAWKVVILSGEIFELNSREAAETHTEFQLKVPPSSTFLGGEEAFRRASLALAELLCLLNVRD